MKDELKTLKDFGFTGQGERWDSVIEGYHRGFQDRLRAEAIREIRLLRKQRVNIKWKDFEIPFLRSLTVPSQIEAIEAYIIWKNNLSSEDLK